MVLKSWTSTHHHNRKNDHKGESIHQQHLQRKNTFSSTISNYKAQFTSSGHRFQYLGQSFKYQSIWSDQIRHNEWTYTSIEFFWSTIQAGSAMPKLVAGKGNKWKQSRPPATTLGKMAIWHHTQNSISPLDSYNTSLVTLITKKHL